MARRYDTSRRGIYREGPQPRHFPIHPAMLEEEIEIQHGDMQKIIAENQIFVEGNRVLQRELMVVKDEINMLSHIVPELQAEKETHIRELIHNKLKLEAELRGFEPLKTKVMHLRDEVEEYSSPLRKELTAQVQYLTREMARAQDENRLLGSLETQIDERRKDVAEARKILEYERKVKEEQVAHRQLLEVNLISLAHERERLQAELTNAERRTEGIGGNSFDSTNESPNVRHSASAYGYSWSDSWESYDEHDPSSH